MMVTRRSPYRERYGVASTEYRYAALCETLRGKQEDQ
jgi:hypothetical protein